MIFNSLWFLIQKQIIQNMKAKITYNDFGTIRAKIVKLFSWYDIGNQINMAGITEYQVIKVEIIQEAEEEEIVDTTI